MSAAGDLARLTLTVAADARDEAMAEAIAVVGSGCQEDTHLDGRAVLTFWVPIARAESVAATLTTRLARWDAAVAVEAQDDDWRDALRRFHQPITIAGVMRIRPPWVVADDGLHDVVIDPGMAFGTGQHDTTRGCCELLTGIRPGSLLDVGCGSGVLAIAARRLGFAPVTAIDFDPLCVEATLANARANGVALTVAPRAIGVDPLPAAEVVVANLTAGLLETLADVLEHLPRDAVVSGLTPAQAPAVCHAWQRRGLREVARRETAEWVALHLSAEP